MDCEHNNLTKHFGEFYECDNCGKKHEIINSFDFTPKEIGTTESIKLLLIAVNELRFKIESVAEINGNDILWDAASEMSDTIALLTEAGS